ncbi:FtsX-like permease family protein [Hymenobacter setariae]|uniref:FtsX-like permease family protein n=1 Tax=Hymenobacter setariae TaxID=2594794 RepID=A0A558BMN4_9BACT|nr:FtsX-like permease family protein [Hymenobacter setariae]TVT37768.1 FtsX-like permease family protein [Hymenobacter setariae]
MLRHLFTLMWNRKRANGLLILEVFMAFVVLFAVGSTGVYLWRNYQAPLGFAYENVWQINLNSGSQPRAEQVATLQRVLAKLRTTPGVEVVSRTEDTTPFSYNGNSGNITTGTGDTQRRTEEADFYSGGPELREVMGVRLVAGRWFDRRDETPTRRPPVVITEATQAELFPDGQSALGKVIHYGFHENQERVVVGISGPYRAGGELSEPRSALFGYISPQDTTTALNTLLVRVQPGTGAALAKRLSDDIRLTSGGRWSSDITTLREQRLSKLKVLLTLPAVLGVVCVFLLVNVALGLFGVLWLNINQRRAELGVRRAMGATGAAISGQVLGEILTLTTFGLVLGLLVAAQFPLLGVFNIKAGVYLTAMLLATLGLYALAAGCAFYPSRLAAGIQPAVALREE